MLSRALAGLLLVALLAGCTSQAATPPGSSPALGAPAAPKILRVAILTEPASFISAIAGFTTTTGGAQQPTEIAHNWLTLTDSNNEPQPALAAELPSLERGTWQVNPDGTMETRWQLRPGIQWHDGAGFTSDDVVFGWEVVRDPALPAARSTEARLIAALETPDATTLVMKWNQIWVEAHSMGRGTIEPLPRHLMSESFARDKDAFLNSSYWSTEFIGLGPFRLAQWVPGSHVEFTRFDGYYRGPAPLDSIVLRFITDPNALVSAILAEEIDVVLPIFSPPNHPYRKDVEGSIPPYRYDTGAAARALGEAGWTRAGDGQLRNAAGATLSFQFQATRNAR